MKKANTTNRGINGIDRRLFRNNHGSVNDATDAIAINAILDHKKLATERLTSIDDDTVHEHAKNSKPVEVRRLVSLGKDMRNVDDFGDLLPVVAKMMYIASDFKEMDGEEKKILVITSTIEIIKALPIQPAAKTPLIMLSKILLPKIIDALFNANMSVAKFKRRAKKCAMNCIS